MSPLDEALKDALMRVKRGKLASITSTILRSYDSADGLMGHLKEVKTDPTGSVNGRRPRTLNRPFRWRGIRLEVEVSLPMVQCLLRREEATFVESSLEKEAHNGQAGKGRRGN